MTPIYIQDQWPNIDWYQYLRIFDRLPANMRRVAELVGIEEGFLACAVRGRILTRTEQQRQCLAVHRRFFAALALQDLVHEVPVNAVARRYGANRGMLQSLQGSAATFAGMVTVFCEKLGWTNMALLLSQFQSRLSFGVERDLCDLVRISLLNAARARMLYNAGYHTIASVAAAPSSEIENILRNAAPFVSGRRRGEETETEVRERSEARVIWVAGRRGLTEGAAAKLIVREAKQLLQSDVAQLGIQWKPPEVGENPGERGNQGEFNISSATDVFPKFPSIKSAADLQSKTCSRTTDKKEPDSGKNPATSKTDDAVVDDSSSNRPNRHAFKETVENGKVRLGNRCQEPGPSSRKDHLPIEVGAELLIKDKRPLTVHEKGQVDSEKAEKSTSVASEAFPSSKHPEPAMAAACVSTSKNPSGSCATVFSRSRNKRRSPIHEIPEPQEKLQKKEIAALNIPEVIHPEPSRNCSSAMEVSADSKVCNEAQSVSVELYSEPFEGEDPGVEQKPDDFSHRANDVVLDSQALTCSLSDTCLMECDVMGEDRADKPTGQSRAMNASQDLLPVNKECEVVCDKVDIAATDQTDSLAELESQDIIGEFDTQPRPLATGEFDAEHSVEMLSSFASPALHSSKCSVADDLASVSAAANSFSLRLSSSDGCLDSDLSTVAIAELMEKESEGKELLKEAETSALLRVPEIRRIGSNFTKIKNSKYTDSPVAKDQKSPAENISENSRINVDEIEGNETKDSDIIPSTPPREKIPSQDDFKTKTSATPLSTRKRPSPRRTQHSSTPDEGLVIIDVAGHEQVFAMFLKEWRSQTRFALAVACERFLDNVPRIGGRFSNAPTSEVTSRGLKVEGEDQRVVGVAVSWGDKDAYYVSLQEHAQSSPSQTDDSQAESAVDNNLTLARRVNAVKSVVKFLTERGSIMVCFDVKEHFKVRITL